ncbi:MAG: cation diffusion facilitator family transporter, partial [Clostridia bacterium]|nr:cation diffusion facilitator family transporter [Clostridia bacterium]
MLNIFLALFKFVLGFVTGSGAMISDGVHSVADVFSAVIVIIGLKMSVKEADDKHPYGHERFECIAAIILSAILFVTGVGIGKDGVMGIISGQFSALGTPGIMALVAALIPIVAKN